MMDTAAGLESLGELVRMSSTSGVPRTALLLRMDMMPASLSRPEQMRHARLALDPLMKVERAQWHDLPAGRIVLSWKGDQKHLVDQALDDLTRVLKDNQADATPIGELVDVYELPLAGDALLVATTTGLPEIGLADAVVHPNPVQKCGLPLEPLDPEELVRLEQSLAGTDMGRFARRRPISRYNGNTAQLAWEDRMLSIPELIETVAPGRDARSDVWLFRRLTRVLDRRMLSILSDAKELRGAGPFGITLNVASVLSSEFLRFDAALPAALRSRVVISLLPADLASDAGAFAFARNFARGRSYRVCLRAVSGALLPALDLKSLDLDYIQLIWSADLAKLQSLPDAGRARWIVGQPCTPEAIAWGLKQGIGLFTIKPTE